MAAASPPYSALLTPSVMRRATVRAVGRALRADASCAAARSRPLLIAVREFCEGLYKLIALVTRPSLCVRSMRTAAPVEKST